ncbi:MAG TPA: ROK family protein [Acidimicrobiales bacterium]|nr:ROK family protein [Acidimicrobiales bacterium]
MTDVPAEALSLGVDVGGTKVLGVALDAEGSVLADARAPTAGVRPGQDLESAREQLLDTIARVVAELSGASTVGWKGQGEGQGQGEVQGEVQGTLPVGVGVPGLVDDKGVLRFAPNLPIASGMDMAQLLCGRLAGARVVVDNDATCATIGEWVYGAAAGAADAVMVTLGTGIGGGIVADGRVLRGANGFAGEIGHMVVDPGGPVCPCGRRGCWERYASGSGLGRLAREAAQAGHLSAVVHLAGGDPELVRGEHVTQAALAGDEDARAVLEELGWWLALGLANLANVLDTGTFVVGGGLVGAVELVIDRVRRAFDEMMEERHERPEVKILLATLGERSGAIGAAVVARGEDRHQADTVG